MSYVWEVYIDIFQSPSWHLKKCLPKTEGSAFNYEFSVAWISRVGDRKYSLRFAQNGNNDKTFRSLKAAKAYAVAIITLEN